MSLTTWTELQAKTERRYREIHDVEGFSFRIRSLTGLEWSEHLRRCKPPVKKSKKGETPAPSGKAEQDAYLNSYMASLIAMCLVDGDGHPLCPPGEDWKSIGLIDSSVFDPLFSACSEHVGVKPLGDTEKNSEETETSDST